jgi:prepilin-type N-terminal cleavage/methylation domain-containing protein
MRHHRGFSLVELLVVIGIILVLAGISVPMLIKAYSASDKAKARMDLNTVALALEAYKTDFGDYPRPPAGSAGLGAVILCKALVAPGPATGTSAEPWASGTAYTAGEIVDDGGTTYVCIQNIRTTNPDAYAPTSNANYWKAFPDADGADGLGFRIRAGMGKPKPAYLQVDRLKVRGLMITNRDGHPILYYPATPSNPTITSGTGYIATAGAKYNSADNNGLLHEKGLRALCGDYSINGRIDSAISDEKAFAVEPFILLLPGPDGIYGPSRLAGSYTGPDDNNGSAFTTNIAGAATPTTLNQWRRNKQAVAECDDATNLIR